MTKLAQTSAEHRALETPVPLETGDHWQQLPPGYIGLHAAAVLLTNGGRPLAVYAALTYLDHIASCGQIPWRQPGGCGTPLYVSYREVEATKPCFRAWAGDVLKEWDALGPADAPPGAGISSNANPAFSSDEASSEVRADSAPNDEVTMLKKRGRPVPEEEVGAIIAKATRVFECRDRLWPDQAKRPGVPTMAPRILTACSDLEWKEDSVRNVLYGRHPTLKRLFERGDPRAPRLAAKEISRGHLDTNVPS